jgi:hypothetical protein
MLAVLWLQTNWVCGKCNNYAPPPSQIYKQLSSLPRIQTFLQILGSWLFSTVKWNSRWHWYQNNWLVYDNYVALLNTSCINILLVLCDEQCSCNH